MKTHYCTACGSPTTQRKSNTFVCQHGHENYIDPIPGVTIYIVDNDKVLFGIRSIDPGKDLLNPPGGFLELGETAEHAAIREVKEELGITISNLEFLGTYTGIYFDKPTLNITFVAQYQGGRLIPADDLAGGRPVWRHITDLPAKQELSWHWQLATQKDLIFWHKNSRA